MTQRITIEYNGKEYIFTSIGDGLAWIDRKGLSMMDVRIISEPVKKTTIRKIDPKAFLQL